MLSEAPFDRDLHPDSPRILFVGFPESSHTHSWIDLLDGAEFNVRLFAMPSALPPVDWQVKTYLTFGGGPRIAGPTRKIVYPPQMDRLLE